MRQNNRRKFREVVNFSQNKRCNVVLISEISADESGVIWFSEGKGGSVVMHSKGVATSVGKRRDD